MCCRNILGQSIVLLFFFKMIAQIYASSYGHGQNINTTILRVDINYICPNIIFGLWCAFLRWPLIFFYKYLNSEWRYIYKEGKKQESFWTYKCILSKSVLACILLSNNEFMYFWNSYSSINPRKMMPSNTKPEWKQTHVFICLGTNRMGGGRSCWLHRGGNVWRIWRGNAGSGMHQTVRKW